jgi:glycosyltransferase involved in cell wall biosynthesis
VEIAAVMTLRDEVEVVPVNLAYHRALGIDRFLIVDNGSTDGTVAVLEELAGRFPWISWTSDLGPFRQSEMVTALAVEAIGEGADWVVAIDADEFWTADRPLREVLDVTDAGALACRVENFVQSRRVIHDHPASLLSMRYRAEVKGSREEARDLVEGGTIAFVEMAYPPKLFIRGSESLVIGVGNHTATGLAGEAHETDELRVLHAPVRARDRFANRAEHGRRFAEVYSSRGSGWHWRRLAAMRGESTLDAEWEASSYRRGALTVGGAAHPLTRDDRLRNAVLPFTSRAARWSAPISSRWRRAGSPPKGSA